MWYPELLIGTDGGWYHTGEGQYVRILTQQETSTMSSTNTLDGMTVEQLRDLATRAENAAKQQEKVAEEKGYVALGKIDSWEWRVRKSDGQVDYKSNYSDTWCTTAYSEELAPVICEQGYGSLEHMAEILKRVAVQKKQGAFK